MEILSNSHFYNKDFIVFGHRGVPELCPENTIESFQKAIDLNYSGIELDLMQTSDNKLIVHHDDTALINNKLKPINQLNLCQLHECYPNIPVLEDLLDSIGHKTNINIEIKSQDSRSVLMVEKTIKLLKKFNLIDSIIISSFNPKLIKESKKIDDRFATGWILGPKNLYFYSQWKIILKYFRVNAIHVNHNCISNSLINQIHSYNMKVLSYTVNSDKTLNELIIKKIDGIFTDSPRILKISKSLTK